MSSRPAAVDPRRDDRSARARWQDRLVAAGVHLLLSCAAALCVLALVLLAWYPGPLPSLLGVEAILVIMLAVDVVLGPLLTLLVYDRRKRSLKRDLAAIAALQLVALAYGLHAVQQGRPAFVVFVKDRFEIVSPADLTSSSRSAARGNPAAAIDLLGPRWVAARSPASDTDRSAILLDALSRGRDLQHHPRLYVDYVSEAPAALERALPMSRLRALNATRSATIDVAIAATRRVESSLRYLPVRGPARDGAVLIDSANGEVLTLIAVTPW